MKKLLLFAFACFTVVTACNSDHSKNAIDFKNVNQSKTFAFSDLNKLDTFKIELTGRKPEDMALVFKIVNHQGKEIYQTNIKGSALIADTDPNINLTKEKDQIAFLKTITDDFFGEDDFLEPAVMPEDVADKNAPDKPFYDQLKKTELNGFKYRVGKEKNFYIAWDKTEKKVKVYYSCC